jgi:hypothetical protein
VGKRRQLGKQIGAGHPVIVPLGTGHHHVVELARSGIYVRGDCCGGPLSKRHAKQLRRALRAWLDLQR